MKKYLLTSTAALLAVLMACSPVWAGGKPGARGGGFLPSKHVYYPGDTLQIRVVIPRSLKGVWNGEAEAHLVVYAPAGENGETTVLSAPLILETPDKPQMMIEVKDLDTSKLLPGEYQLGLVLTIPEGDPLALADWYEGLKGLIGVARVKFSAGPDEEDPDGDGTVEGDEDGDGYPDGDKGGKGGKGGDDEDDDE